MTNFKNNAGRKRARPCAVTARQDRPPGSADSWRGSWGHMAQRVPKVPGGDAVVQVIGLVFTSGLYE